MANDNDKKYYWLKLPKDFFKKHAITIVESMPNGKEYVLFYLKLCCEAISHNGQLRFSETIPYDENMLSALTNTNVDMVRSALAIFQELKMIEIWDDRTLYLNEVTNMLGSETNWAKKKRLYRENQKYLEGQCPIEVRQELDIDIDKDIDNIFTIKEPVALKETKKNFVKPTLQEIIDYCNEMKYNIDCEYFYNFYESKGWMIGNNKMKNWHSAIANWYRNDKNKINKKTSYGKTIVDKPDWLDKEEEFKNDYVVSDKDKLTKEEENILNEKAKKVFG